MDNFANLGGLTKQATPLYVSLLDKYDREKVIQPAPLLTNATLVKGYHLLILLMKSTNAGTFSVLRVQPSLMMNALVP